MLGPRSCIWILRRQLFFGMSWPPFSPIRRAPCTPFFIYWSPPTWLSGLNRVWPGFSSLWADHFSGFPLSFSFLFFSCSPLWWGKAIIEMSQPFYTHVHTWHDFPRVIIVRRTFEKFLSCLIDFKFQSLTITTNVFIIHPSHQPF